MGFFPRVLPTPLHLFFLVAIIRLPAYIHDSHGKVYLPIFIIFTIFIKIGKLKNWVHEFLLVDFQKDLFYPVETIFLSQANLFDGINNLQDSK
jgi:hypothetical protein